MDASADSLNVATVDFDPEQLMRMLLHDVRSPLSTLGLAIDAMGSDRAGREERRAHTLATTRFERVCRLIDEMELVLSGHESAAQLEQIELDPLLADVLEDVRRAYPEPLFAVRGILGVRVLADDLALRRAFANLLHNAARHARSRVWVRVDTEGDSACVQVCDDGDGLVGLDAAQAFDAHARGEGSQGSGLGLAIVRRVLAKVGGDVRVATDEPQTTFEVRLPLFSRPATG